MRRRARMIGLAVLSSVSVAQAQHDDHSQHHPDGNALANEAPIRITINPEARVSVTRGGELPPAVVCGESLEFAVHIVNAGFLTAPLRVSLVDPESGLVSLKFAEKPLTGAPEEWRILGVALAQSGPLDITIAFRAEG